MNDRNRPATNDRTASRPLAAAALAFVGLAVGVPGAAAQDEPPPVLAPGDALQVDGPLKRVHPTPGEVRLVPREGRPLALLFWGTYSSVSRDVLQELDAFVGRHELSKSMDVYAVGSYRPDSQSASDYGEMAEILGIENVPVLADPDLALAGRLGVQQLPELVIVDASGRILVKQLRGLDHGRLAGDERRAGALLRRVAEKGTAAVVNRTFPFYPGDRLLRRHYPDFELPRFSPLGWGRSGTVRMSELISGERPAVLMFFHPKCKHCQVDVPQVIEFLKKHPDRFDVVGVTKIRDADDRAAAQRYFEGMGVNFPVLEDVGSVSELYNVVSTPTSFYIAPNGNVVSASYYQHRDLEADWMKVHALAMGAPPPPPQREESGWKFPMTVQGPEGPVDLADFEGKPVVLHFWATWCVPCREELPDLMTRMPELERHAEVLLVAVKDDPEKVAAFQEATGMKFTPYHTPSGGLAETIDFGRSVPRTYLLDEHGGIEKLLKGSYAWKDPTRFAAVVGRLAGD